LTGNKSDERNKRNKSNERNIEHNKSNNGKSTVHANPWRAK
jgi:hypothetical protein